MTERLAQVLRMLRDVDGVVGSFVWAKSGSLVARDLPEYFDDELLAEVGPRIQRLYEAFGSAGEPLDAATLVFGEHKLHLRELQPAFVGVLSSLPVNMAALKMALRVVGRRVVDELERAPAPNEPRPDGGPASPRFYRGKRVPE